MNHIAIDLGSKESQICVRGPNGVIIQEVRWETEKLMQYFKKADRGRVILETCAEAFAIAEAAMTVGHEIRVVPATLVRALGVGARGVKTDRRDAQVLSEVSTRIDLPSVHLPSALSRELKSRCGMRDNLVSSRTKLINNVRGYLRGRVQGMRKGGVKTFPRRVRAKLLESPQGLPDFLDLQLNAIEQLTSVIDQVTQELDTIAEQSDVCRRLMTAPGVGTFSALRFVSALDDIGRFRNAHAVESYLGVTPGEKSSSERQHRTSITKAGASQVRCVLGQACWNAWRCQPRDPLVVWAKQVAERRGRNIAIVAMTRKLIGILYALWRDGTVYEPRRAAAEAFQIQALA